MRDVGARGDVFLKHRDKRGLRLLLEIGRLVFVFGGGFFGTDFADFTDFIRQDLLDF